MDEIKKVSLFPEEFTAKEKDYYPQFKISSENELLNYLKQFIIIDEVDKTPYKHKPAYYNKKAHYVNGKKVNRQVYSYIKDWLDN